MRELPLEIWLWPSLKSPDPSLSLSLSLSLSVGMIPQRIEKVSRRRSSNTTLTKPSEKLFQTPNPLDSIHPLQNFRLWTKLLKQLIFFFFLFWVWGGELQIVRETKTFLKRQERREEVFKGQRKPQTDRQTAADEKKKKKKRAVWQAQAHAPSLSSSLLLWVSFSPTFCAWRGDVSSLLSFPISTREGALEADNNEGGEEWWGPQTGTYQVPNWYLPSASPNAACKDY